MIDNYFSGGFSQYDAIISDHRPVALSLGFLILGCTDTVAANYDPSANNDDGSCLYTGCTDPSAENYDPAASLSDGSCTYLVCGDITNDGLINNSSFFCLLFGL